MRRETKINIILSFSLLVLSVFIFSYLKKTKTKLKKSPEKVQVPLLRTIKAVRGNFPAQFRTFGSVQATHKLALNSEVSGKIQRIHPSFLEGGLLKKGETIISLDKTDLLIALNQAEANLELNLAQYQTLQQESANIDASLDLQRQTLELSKRELERQEQMFDKKTISRQTLENSVRSNQAQKLAVLNLENQRRLIPSRLKQIEANIKINRNRLSDAKNRLAKANIISPFNGRVMTKGVSIGQYVNAGARLGELLNLDDLEITTPIPSSEISWLRDATNDHDFADSSEVRIVGKSVKLKFLAPESASTLGKIKRVSAALDESTRSLTAYIQMNSKLLMGENPSNILPGSFCEIEFKGRILKDVIKVPRSSLKLSNIQVVRGDLLKVLPVEILRDEGDQVYVRANIAPDELIVAFFSERNAPDEKVVTKLVENI